MRRIAFLLLFFLVFPQVVLALTPMETVRENVEKVVEILKDPSLKGPGREALRRERLRETIKGIFDFREMAKQSLGRYWRTATEEERKRFTTLFTRLLERQYLGKLEGYNNEKVVYRSERVRGRIARVKTLVISGEGTEIPIEYRLIKKDVRWVVYDVVIEGVSLVANYGSQFRERLRRSSLQSLIEDLQSRVEGDKGIDKP